MATKKRAASSKTPPRPAEGNPPARTRKATAPARRDASVPPGVDAAGAAAARKLAEGANAHRRLQVIESPALMQAASLAIRQRGSTVAFVPTMGALHDGHLQLMRQAREHAEVVVASVFVNPTQFGPNEDLDRYPRDRAGDLMKLQDAGVDLAFFPAARDMYPDGFQTTVTLGAITQGACGRYRPGHFAGVAVVVSKLFNIVQPHVALLGEKDWQQLAVVRRMVKDLNLPVEVVGAPTQREADGLAMSSRNKNLSARDREQAPALYRALQKAQAAWRSGAREAAALNRVVMDELKSARGVKLQYVEVVDEDIQPVRVVERPSRLLLAAYLGAVRLIDNVGVGPGF